MNIALSRRCRLKIPSEEGVAFLLALLPMEKFCGFPSFGDNQMPFSVTLKELRPATY